MTRAWLALVSTLALTGCAALFPPTLISIGSDSLPVIDGVMGPEWDEAPSLELIAKGNTDPDRIVPVEIRSVHAGGAIAFLFRWPDPSRSDAHRGYDARGLRHDATDTPDDQFAVKFNLSGPMLSCMLAGRAYTDDVWHWKAARTNATGYAQDRRFVIEPVARAETMSEGVYVARNGKGVRVIWIEDEGQRLVVEGDEGNGRPGFTNQVPSGSQADVKAKGAWAEGYWTLEMSRKLETGREDDAVIDPDEATKFAVAIFDASEGQVHANTRFIKLKLRRD